MVSTRPLTSKSSWPFNIIIIIINIIIIIINITKIAFMFIKESHVIAKVLVYGFIMSVFELQLCSMFTFKVQLFEKECTPLSPLL